MLTPTPGRPSLSVDPRSGLGARQSGEFTVPPLEEMALEGSWSFKDLPRTFGMLFEPWRIIFATGVLWASLVFFALVGWLGSYLGEQVPALRSLFILMAWGSLLAGITFVSSTLSFLACRELVEGRKPSVRQGVDWFKAWAHSLVGAPLVIFGLASVAVIIESLVGLLGRVPTIGPYLWSLGSPLVATLSLGIGLLALFSFITFMLLGPITYFERSSPISVLRRVIELVKSKPFATIGLCIGGSAMVAGFLWVTMVPAWAISTQVTTRVAIGAFGPEFMSVVLSVPDAFAWMLPSMVGVPMSVTDTVAMSGGGSGAGSLLGMASGLVPAFFLALVFVLQNGVGAVVYCVLTGRRHHEG